MALHGDITLSKIRQGVQHQKPFRAGNVSGIAVDKTEYYPTGRLDQENAQYFRDLVRTDVIDYVLYSYGTPIAMRFKLTGWWGFFDQTHSVSTKNHINTFKRFMEKDKYFEIEVG